MDTNEMDSMPPTQTVHPVAPLAVAPAWHTVLLVIGIVAASVHQAVQMAGPHPPIHRLTTYALTATVELGMLAWIVIGLRIRKTSFRSLLGAFRFSPRSIALDFGIALVFWLASLMVLGTFAIAWAGVHAALTHRLPSIAAGHAPTPDASQQHALQSLSELAPSNGQEIAGWILLCLIAGFVEEIVFRGYLQRQFIALARGRILPGVVLAALCFGVAHGYEGARGMFLISIFGALFSMLALYRRSLRPGMIAHAWQDLLAGLALAFLKFHHFL